MVYDELLEKHMKNFMNGYNVNFLAYGQTGTGKTHTLLGPPGAYTKYKGGTLTSSNIPEDFGILCRLVMNLLEKKGDAMLTMNCTQSSFMQPLDILNNGMCYFDWNLLEYFGQQEHILTNGDEFLKFAQ